MGLGKLTMITICVLTNAWPSVAGEVSLARAIGRTTCNLRLSRDFRVPLRDGTNRALIYHYQRPPEVVALVDGWVGSLECEKIVRVLRVPRHRRSEGIEFDCHLKGQQSPEVILGLGSNRSGRRYIVARRAWRLDRATNEFRPLTNVIVICDTAGSADSGD